MTDLAKAIEALEMTLARRPGSAAGLHKMGSLKLANSGVEGAIAA